MNELRKKIIDTLKEGEPKADIADAILDAVIAALPSNADIPQLTLDQLDGFTAAVFQMRNTLQSAKENK